MTRVVIDASAGAEIVARTLRGLTLARLVPAGAEEWVPEHFYAEVLSVVRRQCVVDQTVSQDEASSIVRRLRAWPLHRASVQPLIASAWTYRHNISAADALYVALAEHLGAALLTSDHRLANGPTFPPSVEVLRLPH